MRQKIGAAAAGVKPGQLDVILPHPDLPVINKTARRARLIHSVQRRLMITTSMSKRTAHAAAAIA